MDNFVSIAGPNEMQRGVNIAKDPLASAKIFQYIISAMLETLMGIKTTSYHIQSEKGVFGEVAGYFGVVEAQGRGSLHVQMLVWLKHAPNGDNMVDLL